MASIDWPASLPQVLRLEGLKTKDQNAVVRTDMDAGPAKVRLRFTSAYEDVSGSVVLTQEELSVLQTFFRTACKKGAVRFNMMHPITSEIKEFRFKSTPDLSPSGDGNFIVSLELEALP